MKETMLFKVIISMGLSLAAGLLTGPDQTLLIEIYGLIGKVFLNALSLAVLPLVIASLIAGTAKISSDESFGPLGIKTASLFLGMVTIAVLIGLGTTLITISGIHPTSHGLINFNEQEAFAAFQNIIFKLVPVNIFAALSQGEMLGLILFSLIFGFYIPKVDNGDFLLKVFNGIFEIMMKITKTVMKALPIGVFGLMAKVFATTGVESIKSIGVFFFIVLLALAIHALIALPLLLKILAGVSPYKHYKEMAPALLTAFSTSSSAATLPLTIECVEKGAGVSSRISNFILPLATALNLSGTALYVCVSALFICHSYGVDLSFGLQLLIVMMSIITSFGMAGVPSASLVTIMLILNAANVPTEGVALIMAVERILDMFRTVVNVLGNTCSTVIIAKSEGEAHVFST